MKSCKLDSLSFMDGDNSNLTVVLLIFKGAMVKPGRLNDSKAHNNREHSLWFEVTVQSFLHFL